MLLTIRFLIPLLHNLCALFLKVDTSAARVCTIKTFPLQLDEGNWPLESNYRWGEGKAVELRPPWH